MASSYNRASGVVDSFTIGSLTGIVSGADHGNKADAMNKVQAQVVKEAPLNLAWPEFGLSPSNTGAQNDTAIAAGKAALGASGGTMLIPEGDYTIGNPSFDDSVNVVLQGMGGLSAGATPGTILRSASTTGPIVSAKSTHGFRMADLMLLYSNASFTGYLLDFQQSAALTDSAFFTVDRCYLGGSGVRGAAGSVLLNKAIVGTFNDCHFAGAARGVVGRTTNTHYSNAMSFNGCTFGAHTYQHTSNAGEGWTFDSCTFENLVTGGGAAAGAGAYTYDAGYFAEGLAFTGCWFGDATASGDWINFQGQGLTMTGNYIGAGSLGVRLGEDNQAEGVSIKGNRFDSMSIGIAVRPNGVKGLDIVPNSFVTVTSPVDNAAAALPSSVASTAALVLPATDDAVLVTGTANITSISAGTNAWPGRCVTLVFSGTASGTGLTNGSNLKIGANFVYTPDDVIQLVCNGTNWYRVATGAVN